MAPVRTRYLTAWCCVQIREREEALREAEQEAARDKERIDAIIAKVNEEDRREVDDRIRRKVSPHTIQRGGGRAAHGGWACLKDCGAVPGLA